MSIRLTGSSQAQAELRRYSSALRGMPARVRSDAARRIALLWRARIEQGFEDGTDPDGKAWKRPKDGGRPMVRSGKLRRSYKVRILPDGRGMTISFESTRYYSWYLQKGIRGRLVARKQVPDGRLPPEWAADAVQSYQEATDAYWARRGGG